MMHCPHCGAGDVTRAAMEWRKGTQVSVRGAGAGRGRRIGPVQQSLSAYQLAPPDEPRAHTALTLLAIVLGAGVALTIWTSGSGLARRAAAAVLVFAVLAPIVGSLLDLHRRRGVYARAVEHWNQLWFCNRCGHIADEVEFRRAREPDLRRADPSLSLKGDFQGAPPIEYRD